MARFRPLLAYKPKPKKPLDLAALRCPMAGSFKYDGFRALRPGSKLVTRNIKPVQNRAVRVWLEKLAVLQGCDGELVSGDPTAPGCFKRTSSQVTTRDAGREGVRFILFDDFTRPHADFRERWAALKLRKLPESVEVAPQVMLHNVAQVEAFEEKALRLGYEGIMLRSLDGRYKYGRSTLAEQFLVAVKRHEDSEALILGWLPRMRNDNPQKTDKLGYSKRGKKKEHLVEMPEVGKFLCRDLKTKVEFECGTGVFTRDECAALRLVKLKGKILKYRFNPYGVDKKPRYPRALGFRSRFDF